MSTGSFVMMFDLTPDADAMTLAELITEAEGTRVSGLLAEHQLIIAGPIAWQIDPDEHTPHLIGRAPVVAWAERVMDDAGTEVAA